MSIIRRPARTIKNNAKWEAFQPVKIEGKDRYTQKDIAKVFGLSPVTICSILSDAPNRYNECLIKKVRAFAKEVKYGEKMPEKEKPEHISVHLSTRHYSSKQERSDHMLKLRDDGYTNAQIAKFTGYDRKTVFRIIGAQPDEYTAMSHERAGKMRKIICENRKALSAAARQKKVDAANAQVESYNAAVDELARLDEAVAMAKMKYIQQKNTVEKMRGALSSCAEYATIPIKPMPDAEQNGENRPN